MTRKIKDPPLTETTGTKQLKRSKRDKRAAALSQETPAQNDDTKVPRPTMTRCFGWTNLTRAVWRTISPKTEQTSMH